MNTPQHAPHALILIGTHCPHCPTVLSHLSEMVKHGDLASLKVINIEQAPEEAQARHVRSVPWIKIGDYTLTGLQTRDALQQRVQWSKDTESLQGQFDTWLSDGRADEVIDAIKQTPESLRAIMALLGDPATVLSTRIGIGVVMEDFAGSEWLNAQLPTLMQFSQHEDDRIRADACHYLGMTRNPDAQAPLEKCLDDTNEEVREIAADSLEALRDSDPASA